MFILLMALACGSEETPPNGGSNEPNKVEGPAGDPPPQGGNTTSSQGQGQNGKTPPTFIFNAQSQDKGTLYKAEDGTCFVRLNHDQPAEGEMGPTEVIECPSQMSQEGWVNCIAGRLVRHNTGDKEGTCECQPVEGKEPLIVDCL